MKQAVNESPAPTVSTSLQGDAGMELFSFSVMMELPLLPKVRIISCILKVLSISSLPTFNKSQMMGNSSSLSLRKSHAFKDW